MPLIALYSSKSGVYVVGSAAELREIAEIVRRTGALSFELATDPRPYELALERCSVEEGKAHVIIAVLAKTLRITGSAQARLILAENIEFLAANQPEHLHIEYYSGHQYLEENSEPMTLELL